jgi:chaperonin GroEL (HSP60 family)
MDKMLVDSMGDVVITNDGATILKEMDIEHPAAKMIIEIAKTQEQHCFDGDDHRSRSGRRAPQEV